MKYMTNLKNFLSRTNNAPSHNSSTQNQLPEQTHEHHRLHPLSILWRQIRSGATHFFAQPFLHQSHSSMAASHFHTYNSQRLESVIPCSELRQGVELLLWMSRPRKSIHANSSHYDVALQWSCARSSHESQRSHWDFQLSIFLVRQCVRLKTRPNAQNEYTEAHSKNCIEDLVQEKMAVSLAIPALIATRYSPESGFVPCCRKNFSWKIYLKISHN